MLKPLLAVICTVLMVISTAVAMLTNDSTLQAACLLLEMITFVALAAVVCMERS